MVSIIDDRDDVWQGCANLVQVKPYHYFLHTGDIHSPPGMDKRDDVDASRPAKENSESSNEKDREKAIDRDKNVEKEKDSQPETEKSKEQTNQKTENSTSSEIKKEETGTNLKKEAEAEEPQLFHKEDHDDYLLYLEDILKRIHSEFYDSSETDPKTKTLKEIIPRVKSKVLQGLTLTFSGLIPNNQKIQQSRAYKVARAFGAKVSQVNFIILTTLCVKQ